MKLLFSESKYKYYILKVIKTHEKPLKYSKHQILVAVLLMHIQYCILNT